MKRSLPAFEVSLDASFPCGALRYQLDCVGLKSEAIQHVRAPSLTLLCSHIFAGTFMLTQSDMTYTSIPALLMWHAFKQSAHGSKAWRMRAKPKNTRGVNTL